MLQKPRACYEPFSILPTSDVPWSGFSDNGCCLAEIGKGFSKPDGSGRLGIVGIGESLGKEEVRDGLPFRQRASAGSKLEECLKLAGVDRQDLLLWNILGCQPPDNSIKGYENAIKHCKVHFDRVVLGVRPAYGCGRRVIIAFGAVPFNTLVPKFTGVSDYVGFVFDNKVQQGNGNKSDDEEDTNGCINGSAYGTTTKAEEQDYGLIIPTFHPSYLKRGAPELTPLVTFHIQRALEVANGRYTSYLGHPECPKFDICEFPSIDTAWGFYNLCRDNTKLVIVFDIETTGSGGIAEDAEEREWGDQQITQIQFGVNDRESIVFPWNEDYMEVIKALLKLPNTKANHYLYNFDLPRVKAAGCKVNGQLHDTLWMFKHWHPRLPRGLQNVACMAGFPFPWKYTFADSPQWYGGCDTIAPHYILRWLPPMMKRLGVWQGYLDQIRDEFRILSKASDRGIPVKEEIRQRVKTEFVEERKKLNEEVQKLIPDELRNLKPRRKQITEDGGIVWDYGYINEPKEVKEAKEVYQRLIEKAIKEGRLVSSNDAPTFLQWIRAKFGFVERKITGLNGQTGEVITITRWCRIEEFKCSSQQVIRYLEWKRKEIEDGKV